MHKKSQRSHTEWRTFRGRWEVVRRSFWGRHGRFEDVKETFRSFLTRFSKVMLVLATPQYFFLWILKKNLETPRTFKFVVKTLQKRYQFVPNSLVNVPQTLGARPVLFWSQYILEMAPHWTPKSPNGGVTLWRIGKRVANVCQFRGLGGPFPKDIDSKKSTGRSPNVWGTFTNEFGTNW